MQISDIWPCKQQLDSEYQPLIAKSQSSRFVYHNLSPTTHLFISSTERGAEGMWQTPVPPFPGTAQDLLWRQPCPGVHVLQLRDHSCRCDRGGARPVQGKCSCSFPPPICSAPFRLHCPQMPGSDGELFQQHPGQVDLYCLWDCQ